MKGVSGSTSSHISLHGLWHCLLLKWSIYAALEKNSRLPTMSGDIPPCGPALGSHVIEGCMAQHFSLLCCLLSLPAAVHHALRSLTLCTAKREPQPSEKHLKVPWKSSLWSLASCTYHFLFVQTSVEPLGVWSTLLFFFFSTQHNTFHQHLFHGVLFPFASFSPEMQSLLTSEAWSPQLAVLEQVSPSGLIPKYRTFFLCYLVRLHHFLQDDTSE